MSDLPAGIGWTALLVARARANESRRPDRLFDDPLAAAFVKAGGEVLARAEQSLPGGDDVNRWREDSVALRTSFLDGVLVSACEAGCRQVVLLAAGLDARAFRLDWPPGTRLYELEMPDVLSFKERVLADAGAKPRCERIVVPADLRDAAWPARLQAAGFDARQPTAWIAEGLLMYLSEPDRDRLVDQLSQLSSPGSRLALDHRPGFFATPVLPGQQLTPTPIEEVADPSLLDPEAWLAAHGWRAEIQQPMEAFKAHGRPIPPPLLQEATGAAHSWLASAIRV